MQTKGYFKEVYGGLSKEVWLLATAMFINRCGSMVLLFLSVYLTHERALSLPQAGIVISLYGCGSLVGAFIGGKLVDSIGFYRILIGSLLMTGLSIIVLGQMRSFISIAGMAFLVTAFADSFRPANSASITTYTKPGDYTRSIALNRLAMNLGFCISPIVGGFLASTNYNLLFLVDGITSILASIFLWSMLKNHPKKQSENGTKQTSSAHPKSPYSDKTYLYFIFFVTLYATLFFQFFTAFPLYFKNEYHFQEDHIGWLMALNGLGVAVIEMFLIHYIQHKWTQFKFIGLGCILLIGSFAIYLITKQTWIVISSMVLITFSEMFAMPFMSTFAMQRAPKESIGQYSALYSMSWSLALIIAPILGTNMIDHFGFNALWIVLAALAFFAFLGFRWLNQLASNV